ncbi:hypothetical protein IAU60_000484 [Kwoniella sp. DSM 27419]
MPSLPSSSSRSSTGTPSTFHSTRLGLKAVLLCSLLMLGHFLLTTSANAHEILASQPAVPPALNRLSNLLFPTLLWVGITLLETADLACRSDPRTVVEGQRSMALTRTWVEGGLGLVGLALWAYSLSSAQLVMQAFKPQLASAYFLLHTAYYTVLASLSALTLHLIASIAQHAARHGLRTLASAEFWQRQTGGWVGRVQLDRAVEQVDVEKAMV